MLDLLNIKTEHFEFSMWCSNIIKRQQVYETTLDKRGKYEESGSEIRFSPELTLTSDVLVEGQASAVEYIDGELKKISTFQTSRPLFFENVQYQMEWIFNAPEVEQAQIAHRLHSINEGFRFTRGKGNSPPRLVGTLNTGNDVGWLKLPLFYEVAGQLHELTMSFEVLPTKMDLHSDLAAMYQSIDKAYPLWRFSLAERTEQDSAQSKRRGNFPLLWLANFTALRIKLEESLKVIAQAPHNRLQSHAGHSKADRLKGKLSYRLTERIREDIRGGQKDKSYYTEKKFLSVDTPENRFIKMVVQHSKASLEDFHHKLQQANQSPDKQRLSTQFLEEIASWQIPLTKMQNQNFLREVGAFNGHTRESLVLQQKTGYSTVYRIWQQLKFYLDIFAHQATVSMKSVAEIYEVWCFLTLREILIDELGFRDVSVSKKTLETNDYMEYQLKDGFSGAFEFTRQDGLKARLAHEPIFFPKGKIIRSYLVTQRPDILLEIIFPEGKKCIWLFDAKYRIKTKSDRFDNSDIQKIDFVPDDAINQMHRYRDALICTTNQFNALSSSVSKKTRPIFGAFALYPGYFDQKIENNPYHDAIEDVGIGAFAMLPDESIEGEKRRSGRKWLIDFLKKQLGVTESAYAAQELQEKLLTSNPARIPHYGMKQILYPDLLMTAALGGMSGRHASYMAAFNSGDFRWYHLKKDTFLQKYESHVVDEIRFLALAGTSLTDSTTKQIERIWPVNKVTLVRRSQITVEQAGKSSDSEELYYLFHLGAALTLSKPILGVPHRPILNSLRFTTLTRLQKAHRFNEVEAIYREALISGIKKPA
ncbi:restriction endonuclease-like protein [Rouxiella chamberiensis]|uniref:Restriction endonuclease-like protein n=1 Tax=Rouxiella chamberiensis TaxID=1513468 RepID=A0ABY7HME9_9GAMM|nr:restriction endonuclease-like protein [Rouxiella chamberiensis]WAT00546.1 restriction endonuclease-like protein [Rouxiella chamberiensis]